MNTVFSAKLSALRQERGLTQKEAAERLGISAALLSHYERGIRECGLAFLCRAAAFYEVSCDELLGMRGSDFHSDESREDRRLSKEQRQQGDALLRAAALLHDRLPSEKGAQDALLDYFTLAVYRVIVNAMGTGAVRDLKSVFTPCAADALSAAALDSLLHIRLCPAESGVSPTSGAPFSLQAVVTRAEALLQREFAAMLQPKKDA